MRTSLEAGVGYEFGPYHLLPARQILLRGSRTLELGGRAFDMLHLLVARAGEVVGREELIAFVWPSTVVGPDNLKVQISRLRRILQEDRSGPGYIATVAGRGYRFAVPVVARRDLVDAAWSGISEGHTLPPARPLVGREHEISAVERALGDGRLVTLVGPGGVGKTSVAMAAAHRIASGAGHEACFVDLSEGADHTLVPHLVASALGLTGSPADVMRPIISFLDGRKILVVLDNCEHLLAAVAMLASRVLEAGTNARLLVTSREALGVRNEVVVRIEPLATPRPAQAPDVAGALRFAAVRLFALRALELGGHAIVDEELPAIIGLCRALDGLPLAIELAAAKLDRFTPAALLRSLHERLRLPGTGGAGRRHDTLWGTTDWSYRLLSAREAMVFRLLSVFAGAFGSSDVVAMTRSAELSPYDIMASLSALVAKSLVVAEMRESALGYRLLEGMRRYAAGRLDEDAAAGRDARRRHADLVLSLFQASEPEWGWSDTCAWRGRLGTRQGDLRKALDWCFGARGDPMLGIRLAAAAIRFWNEQSSVFEQMAQVSRALRHRRRMPSGASEPARLAISRAWSMTLGRQPGRNTDRAWRLAVQLAEQCPDPALRLSASSGSAIHLVYTGRSDVAARRLERCIAAASRRHDRSSLIDAERRIALAQMHLGRLAPARDRLEALARELQGGMPASRIARYKEERYVSIHTTLAFLTWLTGQPDRSYAMAREMAGRTGSTGQIMGQSNVLSLVLLPIALWHGDLAELERAAAVLRGNLRTRHIAIWEPVCRFYEAAGEHAHGDASAACRMQDAVEDLLKDRFVLRTPMYLGVLAEVMLARGAVAEADRGIERALRQQQRYREAWCLPELLRIKARVAAARSDLGLARRQLGLAQAAASRMGARTFGLRIANDLASLPLPEADRRDALASLGRMYPLFEHQRDSPDRARAFGLLAGQA